MKKSIYILMACTVLALLATDAGGQESCGPPPPAPKHRIKAGEGFPPLPLPVTPLRRTEKKRPPAPPMLMAKINYGNRIPGSKKWDWTTDPGDTKNLFVLGAKTLGIRYKAQTLRLNQFEYTPEEVPLMYFTGHEPLRLSDSDRAQIREFVLKGGYVLGDACCGMDAFAESFRSQMKALFPQRPWNVLPMDHPLYASHYQINTVQYQGEGTKRSTAPPHLEGLNIGCRTAVMLSPYDLSCGWDGHSHDHGKRVVIEDARELGVNILAYTLAYYRLGKYLSSINLFKEGEHSTGDIAVGQIVHDGDWNPDPSALPNLLREVSVQTTGDVQYKTVAVDLGSDEVFGFPFLFLTGHLDFSFNEKEVAHLRQYLENGGFLLASACCGRKAFDTAFPREIAKVLPGTTLENITFAHPIFSCQFALAGYGVDEQDGFGNGNGESFIEGIEVHGATSVIYLPSCISCGWEKEEHPFVDTLDSSLALRLGVNIVVYAMTH